MRLVELFARGYGADKDLNCAERMLHGANVAYGLGLRAETLKLAGPFGSGMAIESVCGAITGALMVVGQVMIQDRAHATPALKEKTRAYFAKFAKRLGAVECTPLKQMYRTEQAQCSGILETAADVLDELMIELGYLNAETGEWRRI